MTQPKARDERKSLSPGGTRERWKQVAAVAHRAGSDDTSESDVEDLTDAQLAKVRERKRKDKADREKYAKIMGLEYFLEMVSLLVHHV